MRKVSLIFFKKDCTGCHACEVAYKQEHWLGVHARLVRVLEKAPDFTPIYCHHYTNAPCVEAGPFEVMQFNGGYDLAIKCDLCIDRLQNNEALACAGVCPTGHIFWERAFFFKSRENFCWDNLILYLTRHLIRVQYPLNQVRYHTRTGDVSMIEISFRGRGGQGVVMASQMLGMAFFKAGMYPQCYSLFGGERRGAPVVSYLRVDKRKILLKCDIKHPAELLFFDSSLIDQEEMHTVMRPGGKVLINTVQTDEQIPSLSAYAVGLVDATAIAEELGLDHVINTTLLGAYCRLTDTLPLKYLIEAVKEMVPGKKVANVKAVKTGYENMIFLQH